MAAANGAPSWVEGWNAAIEWLNERGQQGTRFAAEMTTRVPEKWRHVPDEHSERILTARKAIWQAEALEEAAAVLDAMQTPGNDALELVRRDPSLWLHDRAATLRGGQ